MPHKAGYDFNDVLRKEGLLALKNQLSIQKQEDKFVSKPEITTKISTEILPVIATDHKLKNIKILEREY